MKRTSVKTGLFDQRNRATQKRRRKQVHIHQKEPKDELIEWLNKAEITESDVSRINLTDYLRCTQHFDILPEERLRQLAIHIEYEGFHSFGRIRVAFIKANIRLCFKN